MSQAPKGPFLGLAELPDLSALSGLAPELAQTFVSIASDIALVIDAGGVIRNVALGSKPMAPSAANWVGQRWADTVTGETQTKIEQLLSEVHSGGVTRRREVSHVTQGGSDLPVAYAAVRLGHNGPVLAVGRDMRAVAAIQQRFIESQQELERDYWRQRQAESRNRLLLQAAHDAVLAVDANTLVVLQANRAAGVLFGCDSRALVGLVVTDSMANAARPGVREMLAMARASGRPAEMRVITQPTGTGPSALIDLSATPMRTEDHMRLLVRARTVPAADGAPAARTVLPEAAPALAEAVVVTDTSGRILMSNGAFLSLCKLDGEMAALGRNVGELLGSHAEPLAELLALARRNGVAELNDSGAFAVSAALLTEGDQECIGLTLRATQTPFDAVPAPVGELARAIDRLATQMEFASLPELLQQASDLAEKHLIEAALSRANQDLKQTAHLLGISMDALQQRLQHHRFGPNGKVASGVPPRMLN